MRGRDDHARFPERCYMQREVDGGAWTVSKPVRSVEESRAIIISKSSDSDVNRLTIVDPVDVIVLKESF